jgi:2-polyprenyl-3-methyl-5-hydroxy-6-metoxy-1,4-benzoquinol methylase
MKYEEEYHKNRHNHLYQSMEYYLTRAKVAKHDYFQSLPSYALLSMNNLPAKILDYGCGLGVNTYLLKNTLGYDISKFAVDFCKEKNKKATTDLKSIKNNSFDIVFSSEVLEHVENPFIELKNMRSKLRQGGVLVLVLPIDKWNKPDILDANQHLYNWNFNTITNILVRVGFTPFYYRILRRTGFKRLLPLLELILDYIFF